MPVLTRSALFALATLAGPALAAEAPDTSGWTCKFCQLETSSGGWLEPVLGWVSDDSPRFGDYTGLDESGAVLDLNALWRYRDAATAERWDARVERAGLDSRALSLDGGRQGLYRLALSYDALPHFTGDDARTPFTGAGVLSLPAGWTRAGSTAAMSDLAATLHPVALEQQRERFGLGMAWTPRQGPDVQFGYRREEIQGTGAIGGSFLTLATQLPRPIDQTLERFDVVLAQNGALGQARVAVSSSYFVNHVDALAWENPYTGPSAGADTGQLALAPDNSAQRVTFGLASLPSRPVQLAANVALGRLRQNEPFLAATVNPDESAALPRASLDARVDTLQATARGVFSLSRALRFSTELLHDERDNRTPVATYPQVVMDTFTGAARTSVPYGATRDRWRWSLERRGAVRVAAGYEQERRERRFVYGTHTDEQTVWVRTGWQGLAGTDLRLRVARSDRAGSVFALPPGSAAENPLLRTFHTANRVRDEARADLGTITPAGLAASVNVSYARDDYPDSVIGRTDDRELGYGAQLGMAPVEGVTVSLFAERSRREAAQAGSQAAGLPDWIAEQEDLSHVIGIHAERRAPGGVDFGADYVYSIAEGDAAITAPGAAAAFPTLLTRWHDLRLFAAYDVRPAVTLRLDLLYERYQVRDWALDGVDADTIANLLALGAHTPDGDVMAALLGLRWRFGGPAPAAAGDD